MSIDWIPGLPPLHLLRPLWLLALLPALLIALRWLRRNRRGTPWSRACDDALLEPLSVGISRGQSLTRVAALLMVSVLAVALAGPSWEQRPQPVWRAPVARVLVLDLSRSMLAADLKPSRLARARYAARDLLATFDEGLTGLVAFAGSAFAVVPLTSDTGTVAHLLDSLEPDLMPHPGGRVSSGIEQALALFGNAGQLRGDIIVFTDSRPDGRARGVVADAARDGFRVHLIAVGSEAGAPIPQAEGGWVSDGDGIVLAGVPQAELRALAAAGGGRYLRLTPTGLPRGVFAAGAEALAQAAQRDESQRADLWRDEAPLLALLLAPLAALAFRRGWLAGLVLVPLLSALPAEQALAWSWDALWLNKDQRAWRSLQAGEAETAASQFQDPAWQAAARYRAGDYQGAADAFAAGTDASALYNRGNALALGGDLQAALQAYEAALAANPDLADAAHNRELVAKLLEQQQEEQPSAGDGEQSPQNPDQQQDSAPGDSDSARQDSGQDPAEGDESPSQQAQSGDGDTQDASGDQQDAQQAGNQDEGSEQAEEMAENDNSDGDDQAGAQAEAQAGTGELDEVQQMALDQWLRRLPDDPGGLLRRKFHLQQRARKDVPPADQPPW